MNDQIILDKFSERLFKLVKENGTDINMLAKALGIKSKSTIYRYMNGEMSPKITTIKYLAEYFNVDEVWLMGYDVPMERNFDNNIQGKEKVSNSAVVFVYGKIPAGVPMECIEDIIDTEEIDADMLKGGKQYFGLRVKGNSMEPEYLDSDTLILEKVDNCDSGDDCVVMVNGNDGTFKRVFKDEQQKTITLQPLNMSLDKSGKPLYQPITFTNEQIQNLPVRIIGIVVEIRRKKKKK